MEVHLTADQEAFIRKGVEAGRFSDAETALLEAFDFFREEEEKLEWLRAEIQIGIDQLDRGEGITIQSEQLGDFFEDVKKRGRERLARENQT